MRKCIPTGLIFRRHSRTPYREHPERSDPPKESCVQPRNQRAITTRSRHSARLIVAPWTLVPALATRTAALTVPTWATTSRLSARQLHQLIPRKESVFITITTLHHPHHPLRQFLFRNPTISILIKLQHPSNDFLNGRISP
jgi:hypothetical protein